MFSNSQIHPNSTDKFYRLRQIHSLLNTVGLLTLVQGHRTRPILKQDTNKHGYRKHKVISYIPPVVAGVDLSFTISNTKDIILEEDDIYYYCDSTGSRVPILPGTDSTGSYRVLLLYTTVHYS